MKIVEKDHLLPASSDTANLPADVIATGADSAVSNKNDYLQSFDQNWNPQLGYPNYKIARTFYFGGMKKELRVPISMPNRVIIEPNPPRQGFSHLTWNTLNEYYLQKCMKKKEYNEILVECMKIAFKVYAINREENRFLKNTVFMKLSNFVWFFCILSVFILILSELDEEFNSTTQKVVEVMFTASILMVFIMSIVNFLQSPPLNIFINYEKFLRQQLRKYFQKLNPQYAQEGKDIKFDIAQNDTLWLEISIPKHLQVPFSEREIARQIEYLDQRAKEEDGDQYTPTQLYQVVSNQQEADDYNRAKKE